MNSRELPLAVIVMVLCVLGLASAPSQDRDFTINGDDQTETIDCKGRAVMVSGDDNNLTLQGECSKLTVSGDDNTINARTVTEISILGDDNNIVVDTVARINTIGDDNNVTWTKGVGGKSPEISNTGDENTTRQAGK